MAEALVHRRPRLSVAPPPRTIPAEVCDEYGNTRRLQVAEERPLTIYVDRRELVTLMTLGREPELLVLGYLYNQGLFQDLERIASVQVDWETGAAAVATHAGDWHGRPATRTVTSGCGQGTVYGDMEERIQRLRLHAPMLSQTTLYALLRKVSRCNEVYREAGAVHGCALCRAEEVLHFVEDVGRHNAVDSIAGRMWLESVPGHDKIFYTTGRLTSEMVMKVAWMEIPVLVSRSGVTSMGLRLARSTGVTLIARAQGRHFLVYHGAERIRLDARLPPKRFVANLVARVGG